MKSNGLWMIWLLALLFSCSKTSEKVDNTQAVRDFKPVPAFNPDSAYAFIQKQVDFGPRVPNTPEHKATRQWLMDKFRGWGLEVQGQELTAKAHDGRELQLTNIIASYKPEQKKRIILAAHWDTRRIADKDSERIDEPIDGANDGGSGVGVLLEVARVISEAKDLNVGIDIILFDGEDDGKPNHAPGTGGDSMWWCLGSQYWSKTPHEPGYSAYYGILLDMVGAKGARFYKEGVSVQYASGIVNKVWGYGHHLGYSDFFQMRESHPITDDHIPVNEVANIPMINIIDYSPDYGFGHYHHTHSDNMEIIDKHTLQVVGETVLFTIYQE